MPFNFYIITLVNWKIQEATDYLNLAERAACVVPLLS